MNEKQIKFLNNLQKTLEGGAIQPAELVTVVKAIMDVIKTVKEDIESQIQNTNNEKSLELSDITDTLRNSERRLTLMVEGAKEASKAELKRFAQQLKGEVEGVKTLIPNLPVIPNIQPLEERINEIEARFETSKQEIIDQVEKNLPQLSEPIRDALELITDEEEKLKIEAVGNLRKELDEIKSRPSGGGGSAGARFLSKLTDVNAKGITDGQALLWDDTTQTFIPGSAGGGSVSDDAYGAGWNGVTDTAPSQNAVYDKIEALSVGAGDLGPYTYIVDAAGNGDYTDIQDALDAIGDDGGNIFITDGTYTITSSLLVKKSRTNITASEGAIIQCNGASVSPLIKPNTTGLQSIKVAGGKWLQTNATAQGTAFAFGDAANCHLSPTRIENFGLALDLTDTANTTFYNHYKDIQIFDCNNGINIDGNPVNTNTFTAIRIRQKAGGAGTGINIANGRSNTFVNCDVEPATGTGITGIALGASAHYNSFFGGWIENNATNVTIDANAARNSFYSTNISSPVTTNISDASTLVTTGYFNVNDNGVVRNNPGSFTSTLLPNDINMLSGAALRTRTSAGNTFKLAAYDVDGTAYVDFATLTANNTPTMDLSTAVTIGGDTIVSLTGTQSLQGKTFVNLTDNASVQVASFEGDRATPADADEAYISLKLSNDGGTQSEFARLTWVASDVNAGTNIDGALDFSVVSGGSLAKELSLDGANLRPFTSDGLALGSITRMWSDLFLASGGVINFNNGNATLTHSAGLLTSNVPLSLGTSNALTAGTIELGAASDTTLSRSAAGTLAVEGVDVLTTSNTKTVTNKRVQPRTASSTSNANLSPDVSSANIYFRTTQTTGLTIDAPTGTPVIGETIAIYVDSAGAQTLTIDSTYKVFGAAFPASTTAGKTFMMTAQYNGTDWKTLWANAI